MTTLAEARAELAQIAERQAEQMAYHLAEIARLRRTGGL